VGTIYEISGVDTYRLGLIRLRPGIDIVDRFGHDDLIRDHNIRLWWSLVDDDRGLKPLACHHTFWTYIVFEYGT